ncbi:hypothetical protein Bbelb_295510 [Branchiostoma belcheri]|nr:hypothetical protein Bbelb_295510 [Branchiostoma belcheri]
MGFGSSSVEPVSSSSSFCILSLFTAGTDAGSRGHSADCSGNVTLLYLAQGPSNLHVDPVKVRHKVIDSGGQQAFLHVCNCAYHGKWALTHRARWAPCDYCGRDVSRVNITSPSQAGQLTWPTLNTPPPITPDMAALPGRARALGWP